MIKQLLTEFLHDAWEKTVGRVFFAITSRWVLGVAFVAGLLSLWIAYEVPRSGKRLYGFFESLSQDQGFATFLGMVLKGFGKASTTVAWLFASLFNMLARPYLDRVLQVAVAFLLVLFALLIVNMLQPLARQMMPKTAPHWFEDPIGPRRGPFAVMLIIFGWSTIFACLLHTPPHLFAMILGVPVHRADTVFFVWSGLVAVATLVLLRTFARYSAGPVVSSVALSWTTPPSLKEAYDRLVARNSPELLANVQLGEYQAGSQKEGGANQVRCSQVAARVGAFYNLDSAATENFDKGLDAVGRNSAAQHIGVVIDEPIGPLHVRFFAEAILSAQDRGGTTLILCPESEIEDVKTRLIKAVSEADKGRLQQIWPPSDVDRIDELDHYTFIIASETIVQNRILGDDRAHFASVLRQVRVLIVLDAATFDPALLRIQLALLRAKLDGQRVRYIVQSTRRRDADGWRYLLGISRQGDPRTANRQTDAPGLLPLRLRRQNDGFGSSAFYCAVFREERTAALRWYEELEPNGMILPPAAGLFPVVLLDVVKPRIRVQHWDPQFSRDATLWEQFGGLLDSRQRPAGGSPDLTWRLYPAGISRSKQPIIDEPRDADITAASARNALAHRYPTIWLAEDCHNLLDLIEDLSGVRIEGEAMAIIVTTSYPLRDILADKERVRRVLRGEPDSLAPLAPQPRIGMRELAMLILMRSIDGLPRAEAVRYFRDVADQKVLAQYRFSPTRLGLKNLLEQQFSGGVDGAVHASGLQFDFETRPYGHMAADGDDFSDDFAFYLPRHERVPDGVNPLVPVLLHNDVSGHSVGLVHQDDHGLAYAENSVILLGGNFYQVRSVERDGQRRVFADPVDPYDRFDIKTGFNFNFWRGYRLGFESHAPSIVVDNRRTGGRGLQCFIVRALVPFARHSYGFYVNDTGLQTGHGYPPLIPEYLSPDEHARRSTSFGHCLALRLHRIEATLLDPAIADRVAFTLAVTLQDLIEALFPGIGHRVAVVCPQAEPVYRKLFESEAASLGQVLARRWPHLIDGFDGDQPIVGNSAQVIGWLNGFAPTGARSSATAGALDIIILEDWGWDLGVIGAVDDKLSRILEAWHEYLAWNAGPKNDSNLYYRMGTPDLHEVFAFREAGEVVNRFRRTSAPQQPEPSKPAPP